MVGIFLLDLLPQRRFECGPRLDATVAIRGARAIRIVQREHGRFGENIRCAEACRMPRISFDLDRAAFDGGDDNAASVTGEGKRGSKLQRHSRNLALGHFHIRDDFLVRRAAT